MVYIYDCDLTVVAVVVVRLVVVWNAVLWSLFFGGLGKDWSWESKQFARAAVAWLLWQGHIVRVWGGPEKEKENLQTHPPVRVTPQIDYVGGYCTNGVRG